MLSNRAFSIPSALSFNIRDSNRISPTFQLTYTHVADQDSPARLSMAKALYSMTTHLSLVSSLSPSTFNDFSIPSIAAVRGDLSVESIVLNTPSFPLSLPVGDFRDDEEASPSALTSDFGLISDFGFESVGVLGNGEGAADVP